MLFGQVHELECEDACDSTHRTKLGEQPKESWEWRGPGYKASYRRNQSLSSNPATIAEDGRD